METHQIANNHFIHMETIKAIMTRRSIRQFSDRDVTPEQIRVLIEAAMNAPSAGDGRPWHFVVVSESEKLDALAASIDDNHDMFRQARAAILIVADPGLEGFPGFYPQDCACAAQNIYLAAHDLGLGTVWIAIWQVPPRVRGIREILKVPGHLEPFAIFPIGYPGENPGPEYRYDESRIHWGNW